MDIKNKKTIAIVLFTLVIVTVIGVTYSFVTRTLTGTKKVTLRAGTLSLVLDEKNEIAISDALPMYDQVGMIQEDVFEFDLINNTSNDTYYTLKLQKVATANELSENDVKYYLTKEGVGEPALLSTLTDGVVDTGTITGNDTINYTLRLWISDTVTSNEAISGKSLSYRIDVEASMSEGDTSCPVLAKTEPNVPQLTSGMIAVTYNETDKTWVKADTTTNDWYDYENQIWANAVTVTEDTRATYMALGAGEPISMDDINTMWVWIPRYSYTIKQPYGRDEQKCSELGEITAFSPSNCRKVEYPIELRSEALALCQKMYTEVTTEEECTAVSVNDGAPFTTFEGFIDLFIEFGELEDTRILIETYPDNSVDVTIEEPGAVDIKFISTNEKDTGTGQCENCAENWVTPVGFTFGLEEIPGFWMAKFETSILESCTLSDGAENTGCDLLTLTPQVKPNVTSWRGARVSTFFLASRLMQSSDITLNYNANTYGFDVEGTSSMDTHMLKNTEWGIVAMLSQSKYGKYGNSSYTEANKEVYQNKSISYITGMSNGTPSTNVYADSQVTYDTPDVGYGASTTGTIYGVYDMSGGTNEYVMGNYRTYSGYSALSNSGFCGSGGPVDGSCRLWPDSKYFDEYTSDVASGDFKFGDATYETSAWYSDSAFFVGLSNPWFYRGGGYADSTNIGVFFSHSNNGKSNSLYGTRLAIKP